MKIYLSGSLGAKRERLMKSAGMRHRLVSFADPDTIRDIGLAYYQPVVLTMGSNPRARRTFPIPKGVKPRLGGR